MRIPKRLQLPEFGKTGVPSRRRFSGAGLPGGHSGWEPPDPIPNSEVKPLSADDSVGSPHVKVGHCQAFHTNPAERSAGFFYGEDTTRAHCRKRMATEPTETHWNPVTKNGLSVRSGVPVAPFNTVWAGFDRWSLSSVRP